MSREAPNSPSESQGLGPEEAIPARSITGSQAGLSTETVYRGRRDPTAPVGKEVEVTVENEPLDCRYDLLSASPSGFEWGYGGSGPAQLAIAMLAHAFGDEVAAAEYQRFKREIVSELPEEGWTLTKRDLDAWRRGVTGDA